MERLRQKDFAAVLRFLQEVHAIRDLDRLPERVGSALDRLISSDFYIYAVVDLQTQKTLQAVSKPSLDSVAPNFQQVFEQYGHENPLLTAHQNHVGALKISDFLTQQELRRLTLYNEFFRLGSVHYQMSVILPSNMGILRGIVVNRGRRDFSERERLLLDLVRPHLAQVWQNSEILDLTRRALEMAGHETIYLDGGRRIKSSSRGVSSLMSTYFQGSKPPDNRMPEALDHWAGEQQGRFLKVSDNLSTTSPFVVDRGDQRLAVRFIYGGGAGKDDILLLSEQRARVSPESLSAIGLSHREAEVLCMAIHGRSVAEVSRILAVSTGTVEKHFENIYVKLGVHSRAAAIARAFEALKAWK